MGSESGEWKRERERVVVLLLGAVLCYDMLYCKSKV